MKASVYNAYRGTASIVVSSARAEAGPAAKFVFGKVHEDVAGRTRALLREYLHCGDSAEQTPAARRLATYLPVNTVGHPLFILKELQPAGTLRDIDADWQLEVMRLRYGFTVHLTMAAFGADPDIAENIEGALQFAIKSVLSNGGVPFVFLPSDQDVRPSEQHDVDVICELGAATERRTIDVPQTT